VTHTTSSAVYCRVWSTRRTPVCRRASGNYQR